MTLDKYQAQAKLADQNRLRGHQGLRVPLLGLFGEVGSLLTLPKRKQREKPTYSNYHDSIVEEIGDVLWYLGNLASRYRISLSTVARTRVRANRVVAIAPPDPQLTFNRMQRPAKAAPTSHTREFEERDVFELGAVVGRLMNAFVKSRSSIERSEMVGILCIAFQLLSRTATNAGVRLDIAARNNLAKIESRWPRSRNFEALFDEEVGRDEQLPRVIKMQFVEKRVNRKTYVLQRCRGINIGDRLTDNRTEQDDYRFHDVFHLAYAAILGWSPVMRALFRVKRKSNPDVDENQDGARAILIEEGIATWIFNHAKHHHHFRYTRGLDYSLLKAIRHLVSGYEVESCPLWQWERAILQGFKVFRQLRIKRKGLVTADLRRRTLSFRSI